MQFKLFGKIISMRVETLPKPDDESGWADYMTGGRYSDAHPQSAIRVAAVFRCVDIISKTIAALPIHLYENRNGAKRKAEEHPLHNLLYIAPNPETTAYELKQMLLANALLTRGGFLKIVRDELGRILQLWNIPTSAVSGPYRNEINGERYIYVTDGNAVETLRDGEFVFLPTFRLSDKTSGENPVKIAADVLGLTQDMNLFAKKAFSGVNPGGFIEYPAGISERAYLRFKEDFYQKYNGVLNSGRWMFLEQGGSAKPFDRDMEKSQVLQSRKWAVTEICRIFGVPPHLCMDMEHATFSNIEQQSLEFVRDCINPQSVKIEQRLYLDLLTRAEKRHHYFKINTNALLRGDTAARTAYYSTMRQNGILNADEIRELEDMNPLPEGIGNIVAINGNMIDLRNVPLNIPKGAQAQKGAATNG